MEKPSETESSEILGDWDFLSSPVKNSEGNIVVSDPTSPESEEANKTRVPDKEGGSTSAVGGEEVARRVMPPWMDPQHEWGGGKWKEDGRKRKKKEKEKEKEKEKKQIIPLREVVEALIRNSGEKMDEDKEKARRQSCVETLKSMGFKFP